MVDPVLCGDPKGKGGIPRNSASSIATPMRVSSRVGMRWAGSTRIVSALGQVFVHYIFFCLDGDDEQMR